MCYIFCYLLQNVNFGIFDVSVAYIRHSVLLQLMFTSRFSWLCAKNKSRLTCEKKLIWKRIYATISAFSSKQGYTSKLVTRWYSRYYGIFLIYGSDKYAKLEKNQRLKGLKNWNLFVPSVLYWRYNWWRFPKFMVQDQLCHKFRECLFNFTLSIKTRSLETQISPEKKVSAQINEFKINSKILCSAMMLTAAITIAFVIFWRQFGRWHVWPHRLLVEDWQRIKIALDVNVRNLPWALASGVDIDKRVVNGVE